MEHFCSFNNLHFKQILKFKKPSISHKINIEWIFNINHTLLIKQLQSCNNKPIPPDPHHYIRETFVMMVFHKNKCSHKQQPKKCWNLPRFFFYPASISYIVKCCTLFKKKPKESNFNSNKHFAISNLFLYSVAQTIGTYLYYTVWIVIYNFYTQFSISPHNANVLKHIFRKQYLCNNETLNSLLSK